MKDYWSELQLNECWSQKERYNILMTYIDEKLGVTEPTEDEEEFVPEVYYFKSYNDNVGTTFWSAGSVQTTGVTSNGYTEVEVLTNPNYESFVGQKFYIDSDAVVDNETLYELFTDDGTTSAGLFVKLLDALPVCNISVSVTDGNDGIGNIDVVLTDGTNEYTGKTGNAGGCSIKNVPFGEYTVQVEAEGYEDYEDTFTVNSEEADLNIQLVPETVVPEPEQQG